MVVVVVYVEECFIRRFWFESCHITRILCIPLSMHISTELNVSLSIYNEIMIPFYCDQQEFTTGVNCGYKSLTSVIRFQPLLHASLANLFPS